MIAADGYNPLRWRCQDHGCYNRKLRPKIERFADCLPGRIAFTDIDASVEVNGWFLILEFKGLLVRVLPVGQQIFFRRLTALSPRITVVVVCADAETMDVDAIMVIRRGRLGDWEPCSFEGLRRRIAAWADHHRTPLSVVGGSA